MARSLEGIARNIKDDIYYMKDFEKKIKRHPRLLIDLYDFCLDEFLEEKKKEKRLYCPYCKAIYDWDEWQWDDNKLTCKEGHTLSVDTTIVCDEDYIVGFDKEEKPVLLASGSCDKSNADWVKEEKEKVRKLVERENLKKVDDVIKFDKWKNSKIEL